MHCNLCLHQYMWLLRMVRQTFLRTYGCFTWPPYHWDHGQQHL